MTSPSVLAGTWWCAICPDCGTSDRHEADSEKHVRNNRTHSTTTSVLPRPEENH